jgi:hypothetical protein
MYNIQIIVVFKQSKICMPNPQPLIDYGLQDDRFVLVFVYE